MQPTNIKKTKIYVIGYPKSGTVWLVRLLSYSLDSSPYVNQAEYPFFREIYARDGKYIIVHSHDKNLSNIDLNTSKIFYLVRDFRDVVVSSFFHHYNVNERLVLLPRFCDKKEIRSIIWRNIVFKLEINKLIRSWGSLSSGRSWLGSFRGILTLRWLKEITRGSAVGSWSIHVNFWTKGHPNVTVIRYEDMLKDTYSTLTKSLSELDIPFSSERVKEAIEQQRFTKRKKLFIEQADVLNARHLRKGVSGDWERFLDKHMLRLIKLRHGSTMNKLGYKI